MIKSGTGTNRPQLFIGSSSEGKRVAEAIQLILEDAIDTVVWSQGLFGLSSTSLERLERITQEFDFAALVVTPDDMVDARGTRRPSARDNVLFEAGLFMGRLGRERTFLVCPRGADLGLPSDLDGMTLAQFSSPVNGNAQAVLGPACARIKDAIVRLGGLHGVKKAIRPMPPMLPQESDAYVPRPRRCNSLGVAFSYGPKEALRIVNISETGALLGTRGELPVGKVLDLELQLDNGTVLSATARVVRVQYPDWNRMGGVGVAFTNVPETSAQALRAFVEDYETDG
jgi:hypothetical protein